MLFDGARGLAQEQRNQRDRAHADRAVDQKAPVPGHIVGEPTAERRPHHRRDDHGRYGFSHEVPNLGVLGASVMGTSGAHNPTLTAQALTWRTAEHLSKNWRAIAN
jgi:choline dehydrogenase-like flavoprotein